VADPESAERSSVLCAPGHGTGESVVRWSEGLSELVKDMAERVVNCAKQILEGLSTSSGNEVEGESRLARAWRACLSKPTGLFWTPTM
jgi:hypothetical protein